MAEKTFDTINDKHLRMWGIPLIVVFAVSSLMPFNFPGRWDLFFWYILSGVIYAGLTWEFCRRVIIEIRRKLPGLENTRRRVAQTALAFFLCIAIGQLILNGLFFHFGLTPAENSRSSFLILWLINFAAALFFVFLNGSIYEALYFFSQYKLTFQKTEQLKKQQLQQQLEFLKTRVNPHFLFNSLTSLSALIGEDAARAERFVDELSIVYRYLLRAGRQPMATLGEELQFADSYAFLLKTRFEKDAFSLKRIGQDLKSMSAGYNHPDLHLPVLSLQNALDYLVRVQNTPLHIDVNIVGNRLLVSSRHQPKSRAFDHSDTEWRILEHNGAEKTTESGRLEIYIPMCRHHPHSS